MSREPKQLDNLFNAQNYMRGWSKLRWVGVDHSEDIEGSAAGPHWWLRQWCMFEAEAIRGVGP